MNFQAVFERLMLTNPSDSLISTNGTGSVGDSHLAQLASQTQVLVYLFESFRRYKHGDYEKVRTCMICCSVGRINMLLDLQQ